MREPKKPKPGEGVSPENPSSVVDWLEKQTQRLESVVDRPPIDSTDASNVVQDDFEPPER